MGNGDRAQGAELPHDSVRIGGACSYWVDEGTRRVVADGEEYDFNLNSADYGCEKVIDGANLTTEETVRVFGIRWPVVKDENLGAGDRVVVSDPNPKAKGNRNLANITMVYSKGGTNISYIQDGTDNVVDVRRKNDSAISVVARRAGGCKKQIRIKNIVVAFKKKCPGYGSGKEAGV
jgi:hypothetical protein